MIVHVLSPSTSLYQFGDRERSSLLVVKGEALLLDCHSATLANDLRANGLPFPDTILHTHIQREHCQEGNQFPDARIYVPKELEIPAAKSDEFKRIISLPWQNPMSWGDDMGREPFGIAGYPLVTGPAEPFHLFGVIEAGTVFLWKGLSLLPVPLPGHGMYALGFLISENGRAIAFASADLLQEGPFMPCHTDIQYNYGDSGVQRQRELLTQFTDWEPLPFIAATGPMVEDGPQAARKLIENIVAFQKALTWKTGEFTPQKVIDPEAVGDYIQVATGIYQSTNFGNTILFVDEDGEGLMVDPGPCVFHLDPQERFKKFNADLDLFEREFGLRRISMILLTHFHGDHIDMVPLVADRYDSTVITTRENGDIILNPQTYRFSAMLHWYNFGVTCISIDQLVPVEKSFHWNGHEIMPVSLPAHCQGHCGFIIDFRGERVAITGDAIQSRGDANVFSATPSNGETRNGLQAFERLIGAGVTLNCGGHGTHFRNCEETYRESASRFSRCAPLFRAMFAD